jgi:hypothetical protein
MVKFLFLLFIALPTFAALTEEDLNKIFLTDSELGPMKLEKILEIDDALLELGMQDVMIKLQMKLDRHEFEFLPSILHVCKLEGDTLGTYQRGTTWLQKSSVAPNEDINDLRIFWEITDPEKYIEENYRIRVVDYEAYVALVRIEWPIICIRPGESFMSVLSTFVHEVEHFLGDREEKINYTDYIDEDDYVNKRLVQSGGEYEAFQAGAQVYVNLQNMLNIKSYTSLLNYFDDNGNLINSDGLKSYILDRLDYRTKFINYYRDDLVKDVNKKVNDYNTLLEWFSVYEQNLNINQSNLEIYANNIKAYENNIKYYEYYNKPDKVQEMKDKMAQAKLDMEQAKASIIFYENLVELKYSMLDEYSQEIEELRTLVEKVRASYSE